MGEVFIKLLNMSITAGWLILAVLCVRFLFRRMPKWVNCLLWGIVAIRLIIPFSIESEFSLQPSAEPIKSSTMVEGKVIPYVPSVDSGLTIVEDSLNPMLAETFAYQETESVAPLQIFVGIAGNIWLLGMIGLLIFAVGSVIRLQFLVREAVCYKENVSICDSVKSPFVLGIVRPRIYLSSATEETEMEYMIAHEKAHIRRKDHLWKPFGYLLLCIYWFNPLCWVAYRMLCKDIELACDEKVIKNMSLEDKKEYSRVLLSCATQKRLVFACPLAFGEVGVKERIQSVLHYKKPAFWITIIAVLMCVIVAVCFLTNPTSEESGNETVDGIDSSQETVWVEPEKSETASEWIVEELYVEKSDITHDGVADYIVTTMTYDPSYVDASAMQKDRIEQQVMYDVVSVKVYRGNKGIDTYTEEALLWSQEYSSVHVGNGQLSIIQLEGKDYLLASNLWGGQGSAQWNYEVFSLNEKGEKEILDGLSVEFEMGSEDSATSITEFQNSLEQYISEGILIVACDIDMEEQFIRTKENPYIPQEYYDDALLKYNSMDYLSEEQGLELYDELVHVVSSIGPENAYPWGYDVKEDTDALIQMGVNETGRFEIYGIISKTYGTYGLLLNDWIDGEENWNFAYVPWLYSGKLSEKPILEPDGKGKYVFAYVYRYDDVPLWHEYILDCGYDTGHMELLSQEEYANKLRADTELDIDYQSIEDEIYKNIILEMLETSTFPATEGIQCNGMLYNNLYAVMDIDDDGKEELLINFGNAGSMAGMVLYIYDYNRETKDVYIEYAGWPGMTVYDNGYIKEEASHNHGRSNLDDFWPYSLQKYNAQIDKYETIANIDAWQAQIAEDIEPDPEFPTEKDLDGDGIVYYDISENYYEPTGIMDNAEYHTWCRQYNEGKPKEIIWYPIISEEKYYEMFPSQAVG